MIRATPVPMARSSNPVAVPARPVQPTASFPSSFYNKDMPAESPAWFSTHMGQRQKRGLPDILPTVVMRSCMEADVQKRCQQLREEFPAIVRAIRRPKGWSDLYAYFDAYDLYTETPLFCFHVITHIAQENEGYAQAFVQEIKSYAREWITSNSELVLNNNPKADLISMVRANEPDSLNDLTADMTRCLGEELGKERRVMLAAYSSIYQPATNYAINNYSANNGAGNIQAATGGPLQLHRIPEAFTPYGTAVGHNSVVPLQIQPVAVPPLGGHTTYQSFMHHQGQRQNGAGPSSASTNTRHNWNNQGSQSGQRRTSNDVPRGFHYQRNSILQHHSSANNGSRVPITPNQTFSLPQTNMEPIYVKKENPQRSSPILELARDSLGSPIRPNQQRARRDSDPYNTFFDEKEGVPKGSIREMFEKDPQAQFARNSLTCTYFYNGPPIEYTGSSAEKCERTAYVKNVPLQVFTSHELKTMMAECGAVESIHYYNNGSYPFGPALVTFVQPSSVDVAIKQYDSVCLSTGPALKVTPHQALNRERSNSNYSQSNYGHRRQESYGRNDGYRNRGHRYSATRGSSGSFNQFGQPSQYQPALNNDRQTKQYVNTESMSVPFQASMAEIERNAALHRTSFHCSPGILVSVENIARHEKKSNDQEADAEIVLMKKNFNKENSPIKSSAGNSTSDNWVIKKADNSKAPGHSNNPPSKKKKNNKKGSKQNTSTKPTPTSTPTKNRSTLELSSMPRECNEKYAVAIGHCQATVGKPDLVQSLQTDQASIPAATDTSRPVSPKSVSASHKNNSRGPTTRSSSAMSNSSQSTLKQGSLSSKSVSIEEPCSSIDSQSTTKAPVKSTGPVPHDEGMQYESPGNNVEKNQKLNLRARNSKQKKSAKANENVADATTNQGQKKNHETKVSVVGASTFAKEESSVMAKNSKNAKIYSNDMNKSTSSNTSSDGRASDPSSIFSEDGGKSVPEDTRKGAKISSQRGHSNSSSISINVSGSTQKKGAASGDVEMEPPLTPKKSMSAPNLAPHDANHWPALGPSTSPQSSIADGKRPPPISTTISRPQVTRKPTTNQAVAPAVPKIQKAR